jgi:hypothetical protein
MTAENARDDICQLLAEYGEQILFGKWVDSYDIDKLSWLTAGITSSAYAEDHMRRATRFEDRYAILEHCLSVAPSDGLVLEFGVYSGDTIRRIAEAKPTQKVYGFDSFEGLPEDWREGFEQGQFALAGLPDVPQNVELIKGWFDKTLPVFCSGRKDERVSFLHVDCDLYSSTQTIFLHLRAMIQPGTIILFDEFFNYPGWQKHEARAFEEFCRANAVVFEHIGVVAHHQQAAVRILG